MSKINYAELPEAVRLFAGMDIDKCIFSFISCDGNAKKNIDLLLPRMTEVMPHIHKALDIAIEADLPATVCSYPLCFLRGYEKHCEELHAPVKYIRDAEILWENFHKISEEKARVEGAPCRQCGYELLCAGPRRDYVEKFGWNEFSPVPGEKILSAEELLEAEGNG